MASRKDEEFNFDDDLSDFDMTFSDSDDDDDAMFSESDEDNDEEDEAVFSFDDKQAQVLDANSNAFDDGDEDFSSAAFSEKETANNEPEKNNISEKQTTTSEDEAYQFNELDEALAYDGKTKSTFSSSKEKMSGLFGKASFFGKDKKKILYIAAGLGLILLIFFVLGHRAGSNPVQQAASAAPQSRIITQQASTTVSGQAMAAPSIVANNVDPSQQSIIPPSLAQLSQENAALKVDMQNMQMAMAQLIKHDMTLKYELDQERQSFLNMQKTVTTLQSQVSTVDRALNMIVQAAMRPKTTPQHVLHKTVPPSQYFVQAVIPGRAWLETTDGHTITVTYGNEIPGWGRVTKIDPQAGFVMTDTGKKIVYGVIAAEE